MAKKFYKRLRDYFEDVAKVLKGDASPASIFPNSTDVGMSREQIYLEFLKMHAPSKCNVLFGGFLYHEDGNESKQVDIIINVDTTPRFNFFNRDGSGKTFSPVEGTVGVVSVKSTLDKAQLFDALENIASIPPMASLEKRVSPMLKISNYDDWPYKVVYASSGLGSGTILGHLNEFYTDNPEIPDSRRPHIIHVAGKYAIFKIVEGMSMEGFDSELPKGKFMLMSCNPDLQAIIWTLDGLQKNAQATSHIIFNYSETINRVHNPEFLQ